MRIRVFRQELRQVGRVERTPQRERFSLEPWGYRRPGGRRSRWPQGHSSPTKKSGSKSLRSPVHHVTTSFLAGVSTTTGSRQRQWCEIRNHGGGVRITREESRVRLRRTAVNRVVRRTEVKGEGSLNERGPSARILPPRDVRGEGRLTATLESPPAGPAQGPPGVRHALGALHRATSALGVEVARRLTPRPWARSRSESN